MSVRRIGYLHLYFNYQPRQIVVTGENWRMLYLAPSVDCTLGDWRECGPGVRNCATMCDHHDKSCSDAH